MLVTKSWIETNYNKFNKLYFGGLLPHIEFKTSRSKNTWGFAEFRYDFANDTIIPLSITLSNYYDSPEDVKIQTLLHEMIHIEDYFFHPEHFIRNGRKVRANYYDAHGYWFKEEAKRIYKESGYEIAKHVTKDEIGRSCLSERSKALIEHKKNNARIVAANDGATYWYFKTDLNNEDKVINMIQRQLPRFNRITVYSFDNEELATRRSCSNRLSGWHMYKANFMEHASRYKFTTLRSLKF